MVAAVRTTKEEWGLSRDQGKFLRVATANTAMTVLREEQARGSFPRDRKLYTVWVDRSPRKTEFQVRFGGTISYIQRQALSEVYEFILRRIDQISPIGPGPKRGKEAFRKRHYYESVVMLVNGRAVISEGQSGVVKLLSVQNMKNIKPSDRVMFMNIQPYARRLEQGAARFRPPPRDRAFTYRPRTVNWSLQAPNGVFRVVAREAQRRFKGIAQIRFTYAQAPALGYRFQHQGQRINQFYPVIVVRSDRGAFEEAV